MCDLPRENRGIDLRKRFMRVKVIDLINVSTVTKTVVLAKMPIMSEFHTDRFFLTV